jgi:hypothetical protein
MREKEIENLIGKENMPQFYSWMSGQTCGVYPDGDTDYYACDVEAFRTKLKTGYDRQDDPLAWD